MRLISFVESICPSPLQSILDRVKASPIGRRIASGAFWAVLGGGLAGVFSFLSMILVARILGKELFGEFGLVRSTAMTFVTFSSFGMGLTATKYIAELLQKDKERVGRIIGLSYLFTLLTSLLVAVTFYLAVPWLCETQLQAPHLAGVMKLGAVMLFISAIMGTQTCVMQGFQDFRGLAIASTASGAVMLPLYIAGSWYGGVWGAVICAVLAICLNFAINSAMVYRNTRRFHVRYSFRQSYKELPILWQSNLPIFLSATVYGFALWLAEIMLVMQPNGKAELGIYYVAMSYQLVIIFVPQVLQSVFFPVISELNSNGNNGQYWHVVKKNWLIQFGYSTVACTPFLLFPSFFMGLAGKDYAKEWPALVGAVLVVIVRTSSDVTYRVLISKGWNWTQAIVNSIGCAIFLAAVWYSLHLNGGAVGLFYAYSFYVICYMMMIMALVVLKFRKDKFQ